MAGDWIKMGKDLLTHPKVVRISSALKADKLRTVGGLFAVWCLFDTHSVDGNLSGYTYETIDDEIRFPGFSAAMESVGWLKSDADGAFLPDFEEHNGQSAKRRAQETERKRIDRKTSASDADKKRTREEKRREEILDTSQGSDNVQKGSRLPKAWSPTQDEIEWAKSERGWSEQVVLSESEKFRDYWSSKPGKDGRKLDWIATWRNWCRNSRTQGDADQPKAFAGAV